MEVIANSFKCIIEELRVGTFTEKDLRFIIEMSKGVMEATVIVIRRKMMEKKDIPAGGII